MNNDSISIVMPAYNCEKYVSESIKSVINQTHKNWELIVINDGSMDNTLSVISKIAIKDSRIRILNNSSNMGVSETRNRGIEQSNGNWIAFLDSDDVWETSKLEKQVDLANEKNAEFIFTGSSYIDDDGIPYKGIFEIDEEVTYHTLRY